MDYYKKRKIVSSLKKFWNFLWNGNSFLSWITFLIIIFIFIKFIFFPILSLVFGTSLPIVIVESCSMYHDYNFNDWWERNKEWYEESDITKEEFSAFPLKNGFNKGDIFFIIGVNSEKIKLGDVIIFDNVQSKRPIIHRVVNLDPLETKGDNNIAQIPFEVDIDQINILGKATFVRIPFIGWIKLIFFEPLRSESDKGFCK